ncbi:hypothetical protein D3C80_1921420 [compost metagenome]
MFAKRIYCICQACRCGFRDDGIAHQVDIVVAASGIFRWQGMSGQTGGFHFDR